jgi:ankyrin repeat protein
MAGFRSDIGRPAIPRSSRLTALDIVRLALEHGANPNAQLSSPIIGRHHGTGDFALGRGATALMRAAKGNDLASMRLLLAAGADQTLALANGQTVVDLVSGGRRGQQPNPEARALLAEHARTAQP